MDGTTHERILKLFEDGDWHNANEICSAWIGGRQGGARLSELSKDYDIQRRWSKDNSCKEYRIPKELMQGQLI